MGTASSRRYIPRAPRYVLSANDSQVLRFAPMNTRGQAQVTSLRNLSTSGLAFTLPYNELASTIESVTTPSEGDVIKIEFSVPGRKQIACFATIVRVDELVEWDSETGNRHYLLIAVQYRNLPSAFIRSLEISLKNRNTAATEEDAVIDLSKYRHLSQLTVFTAATLAMLLSLWYMTLPPSVWLLVIRNLLYF
jgi:hypothetical protein